MSDNKVAWGLWHRGKKKWCSRLMGGRIEFDRRQDAETFKISCTKGKRDALTNYFRRFVSVRRLPSKPRT